MGADVVAANWDILVLDVGGDPLRRIPMMEPLAGNELPTSGGCSTSATTPAELVERLGS